MSQSTSYLQLSDAGKTRGLRRIVQALLVFLAVGGLGTLATFPLAWQDQAILGGALFVLAWTVNRLSDSRVATLTLVAVSVFATVRYLWWRFAETFSYVSYHAGQEGWVDLFFVTLLLAAETYAFVILILGYFQTIQPLDRRPEPLPENVEDWPTVDVFIPTYNEPLSVLKPTVLAARNIDWPRDKMRVWVLDDGCRNEIRDFAERAGVDYVGRVDSRFAKAGNLNNTLRNSTGEFIAIFDCDHVPTRSFLQMTVGAFLKDQRLSMLQTPHHFYTPDPIERNLDVFREIPNEGALFYGVIQKGNDFWNATSFAGSCAVLRRTALEEIGGIAVETVTEDAHTSLRLLKRGWNTAYLDIPQAAGLAAFSLRDHVNQRIRWARGLTQILRIEKPLWSRELTWPQRLCYFNSSVHFLYALPRLIFLTAPLGFLIFEFSNFYGYVLAILAYALPHLFLATLTNARLQGSFRNPYWNEVFEAVLAPFILIPTTLALISPRKGVFNVTPKSMNRNAKRYDWIMAAPFLVLAALNLFGIGLGIERILSGSGEAGTIAINIAWALYSTMTLGVVLAIAEEPEELRGESRIPVEVGAFLVAPDGKKLVGETRDLSYSGARIESPDAASLKQGEQTAVGFNICGQELRIPARVVRVDKWSAQIRFANLSLPQEEALTRVIFSRADAWVGWNDRYPKRFGPFTSLVHLLRLSLVGFGRVIAALFRRAPRPQVEALGKTAESQPATSTIGFLLAGSLFASAAVVQAQQVEPPPAVRLTAPFFETHNLEEFGLRQPIVVQGADSENGFRFWSPLTKVVEQASLELHYQESPSLASLNGTLLVLLNGAEVAALPAQKDSVSHATTIQLPSELFVGDNELSFALDVACAPDCLASEEAAAAWARIERTSKIQLAGQRLPVAQELRLLPMPFLDLSVHRAPQVSIVTSSAAGVEEFEAAGIAASWLGVLSDHRGIRFTSQIDDIPSGHAIVIAKRDSPLALSLGLTDHTRPIIALTANPSDPYGTVLALIGSDGKDLKKAAQALALGVYAEDGALSEAPDLTLPEPAERDAAPRWLDPSEPILFTQIADESDLHVFADSSLDLFVRTPPDLYYGSVRRLPLKLRYRVRDLPKGSSATLTVLMNGEFLAERRLSGDAVANQTVNEELIPVPVETIYPNSTLQLVFSVPEGDQEAAPIYPTLEILGDSELDLTGYRHFALLPQLDLFAHAGFPFTQRPDLSETAIVLDRRPDEAALTLYFNLMGFFGSNTGQSGLRVSVLEPEAATRGVDKDLLIIGKPGDAVFAPWAAESTLTLDQPQIEVREDSTAAAWMRRLSWGGFGGERRALSRALRTTDRIEAAVQGMQSPSEKRAIVAIATTSANASLDLINALQGANGSGALYGTAAFLADGKLQSFITSPPSLFVGAPTVRANVEFWLMRFLWALPLLAMLFAYALARTFHARLQRAAHERLQATS